MDSKRKYFVPVAVVVVLAIAYFAFGSGSSQAIHYGLMFDAGSTGSRVHVYSFDAKSGKLLDEIFREVKPGLSGYPDPAEAAASLKPLLDIAVNAIPKAQHKCTPLAVKATAGLRRLGVEQAEKHLQAVRDLLVAYPFHVAPNAVAIMAGTEEAAYAWITINHLLGRLDSEAGKTVSVMDLGGGSTQIVLEPSADSLAAAPAPVKYELPMGAVKHQLYQHCYDGWGLNAAREKIFTARIAPDADPTVQVSHPCIPQGHTEKVTAHGKEYTLVADEGTSFSQCAALARKILNKDAACAVPPCSFNGVHQPSLTDPKVFSSDMYAISYFYDRTQLESPQPELKVADFKMRAEASCKKKAEDAAHGVLCADLSYMYALLSYGYGLQDEQKLQIAKKINGIETAWCLGAMVVLMKGSDLTCSV